MNKDKLLLAIAELGYNVGFGAKRHFATFDIVDKVPGIITFVSLTIGIIGLVCPEFSGSVVSVVLLIAGVLSLYIDRYQEKNTQYKEAGEAITAYFYQLKDLSSKIESSENDSYDDEFQEYKRIQNDFLSKSMAKQILGSNWFAHCKFFWEMEIGWIKRIRPFSFARDKIPLSLWFFIVICCGMLIVYTVNKLTTFLLYSAMIYSIFMREVTIL